MRPSTRLSGLLLLGLMLLGSIDAHAQFARRSDGSDSVAPTQTQAPPIAWATPLDGDRLRVILIAPAGAMRDAEELLRRMECEVQRVALPARRMEDNVAITEAAPLDAPDAPPTTPESETKPPTWPADLREALGKQANVIAIGNLEVEGLPEDLQQLIVERVRAGTGLLLANTLLDSGPIDTFLAELQSSDDHTVIAAGAMASPVQGGKPAGDYLRTLTSETARVALLDYPGDPPQSHALLPVPPDETFLASGWREDAWSLVLRALRWAANHPAGASIAAMSDSSPQGPEEEEIPPDLPQAFVQSMRDSVLNLPLHNVRVDLAAPSKRAMEAVFQLRRAGESHVAYTTTTRIAKDSSTFGTQLLVNPGAFIVDCILRSGKGTVDWWSMPLLVSGWPEAENVQAEKTFLLPNDSLTISARVRPVFGATRDGTIYARALDPAGTLLSEASAEVGSNGGTVALNLAFADLLAPMVQVEVYGFEGVPRRHATIELSSSGTQILRFPVRQLRREPRFELVLDVPARDEFNARWFLGEWHRQGVGALHGGGGQTAVVRAAELGLALVPPLTTIAPETHGQETRPSLSDPEHLAKAATRIKDEVARYWAGGGGAYSLGWPAYLSNPAGDANPDQSDASLEGFRAWLQGQYGDIATLNAAWKSRWTGFDEVHPPSLAECREAHAPAAWMNWRTYMDATFAATLADARTAVRTLDASAATGIVALDDTDARRGYDWARLSTALDFVVAPSDYAAPERLRSLHSQGVWGGVAAPDAPADEGAGRWLAWKALLEQQPGVWLHNALPNALVAQTNTPIAADGTLSPAFAALATETLRIQQACGPLVLASARARSGVAVLDSRASRLALDVEPGMGGYLEAQEAWIALLRREGFDFTFVSPAQIAAGALAPYGALILPCAVALDSAEAAAIANFAQQGGALLADLAPGWISALGAQHETPLLDDWFGIRHEGPPSLAEVSADGRVLHTDTAVRADKAQPLLPADQALHLKIDEPTQRALLLNHRLPREAGPWSGTVRDFLLAHGCVRAVELANDARGEFIARARFRYGQAEIFTLLAAPDAPQKLEATVLFSEAEHVYDVGAGLPVERPKKTTLRLQPGEGKVLALLPYEVTGLSADGPSIVQQGKRLIFAAQVQVRKGEPGKHLLRVTLSAPGGGPISAYTHWLAAEGGKVGGFIPILAGQAPGFYALEVLDVLSGAKFQSDIKIVGVTEQ